jgi:uncharacterized protein (DUF488 family)
MSPCLIFTVGHSTRSFEEFTDLLRAWRIDAIADVRTVPRSRRNPQFNADALAMALPAAGIAYLPMPALGGWRRPRPDSPNAAWRLASFRGYADYMQTPEFDHALDDLIAAARGHQLAAMCAEAVPWRCHRSLIADALVARGCDVHDILSATKADPHRLTPFARIEHHHVTYPATL